MVRSMTHTYPIHGVAYATHRHSGHRSGDGAEPARPAPLAVHRLRGRLPRAGETARQAAAAVPDNLALPFPFSSQRIGEVPRAGPYAAFLGSAYNPLLDASSDGQATRTTVKTLAGRSSTCPIRTSASRPSSRFDHRRRHAASGDVTLDRLDTRRSLMEQFDRARRDLAHRRRQEPRPLPRHGPEPDRLPEAARRSGCGAARPDAARILRHDALRPGGLTARRLVEAGSRFVSVFWDEYGLAGSGWDTHWNHYPRMKTNCCRASIGAFGPDLPTSTRAACSTRRWCCA